MQKVQFNRFSSVATVLVLAAAVIVPLGSARAQNGHAFSIQDLGALDPNTLSFTDNGLGQGTTY